jgi:hypothetical protein
MIPIYQSIVCPERGDCQSAAIASILELPISEVPPFVARAFDEGHLHRWFDYQTAWLRERGLALIDVNWNSVSDWRIGSVAEISRRLARCGRHMGAR